MKEDFNPFPITGYRGPEYFCNRKNETSLIQSHIKNHKNTTLFAIRRIGKTGLIHHVFNSYQRNRRVICIYLDILGTRNLKEFTNQLGTAIYTRFPENKSIGKKLMDIIKLLRPIISYDALSGNPELSFDLGEARQYEKTISQLFQFLDHQNIQIIFAIDEFQQILEYPEKNTEALLRTAIQSLKNTRFIFCGSNQKMMHELFDNAKRPFFASCSPVHLDYISVDDYSRFIDRMFSLKKRKINSEAISFILDWTCNHTFYVQFLCNYIYASQGKKITLEKVQNAAIEILNQHEGIYYQYRNLLTDAQWNLLIAVAREQKLYNAHAKHFINKYKLGTSSMITRGIQSLLEKELIYYNTTVERPYYAVYDKFLMRWLQNK